MSIQVDNVVKVGTNSLGFVVNSDITGSFSADQRITITNLAAPNGTVFQNTSAATTLNNASSGTSDFQIEALIYPFQGDVGKTCVTLELQGTTTRVTTAGGPPVVGGVVQGLTFLPYSGGKQTVKGSGKITVKGTGKFTIKQA